MDGRWGIDQSGKYSTTMFMAALLVAGVLQAQTNPLITELKQNYQGIKNTVTRDAEKVSEAVAAVPFWIASRSRESRIDDRACPR